MNPLARIAYNMIAEGGEAVGKSAADDVLKAASKIADEGVEGVDDWGWKGGKEGEMSGRQYLSALQNNRRLIGTRYASGPDSVLEKEALERGRKQLLSAAEKNKELGRIFTTVVEKEKALAPKWKTLEDVQDEVALRLNSVLASLEDANVPRSYTGKLAAGWWNAGANAAKWLPSSDFQNYGAKAIPGKLSELLSGMTNDQRETFLAMLPEWTDSLDELAEMARTV